MSFTVWGDLQLTTNIWNKQWNKATTLEAQYLYLPIFSPKLAFVLICAPFLSVKVLVTIYGTHIMQKLESTCIASRDDSHAILC